ncbi:hypothetical protein LZ32DRAFT_227761 [Colletotrichum eremochloae]|nr:hypothetical protein LZ32DRAFT_227761 [Colletotrichum eremochloae]
MEKPTTALKAANWRRSHVFHDQDTHKIRSPRKRNSSTSVTDFDIANPATHWRKPVAGAAPSQHATDPVFGENKHILEKIDGKSVATARCAVVNAIPVLSDGTDRSS